MSKTIEIYDTTLRDGGQAEGVSYSVLDKLQITERLFGFGVEFVEGGWPGSNPKDKEYFERAREIPRKKGQRVMAFSMTSRAGVKPAEDPGLKALLKSGADGQTLVGKTWDFHVQHALGISLRENLRIVEESIAYLKKKGGFVIFDAEHFFDGFTHNPEYAISVLEAAERGGADRLVLCDTNGGSLPTVLEDVVTQVMGCVTVPVGIHAHNDGDMATANSLAAVAAGATHVQGTINGLGERCGNANLCAILPNLALKLQRRVACHNNLKDLTALSRFVANVTNRSVPPGMAFVGRSAFAHKGGIHVSAVRKNAKTYEHLDPALVGNERRILVSELSGKSNMLAVLGEDLGDHTQKVLEEVKRLEHLGYSFEAAEASLKLLMLSVQGRYAAPFAVEAYNVYGNYRPSRGRENGHAVLSEATVQVRVGKDHLHTAAVGDGPVNALDNALRKAIGHFFPSLQAVKLVDYKVRVLDATSGTEASVRVLVESTDGEHRWSTVGVSTNVVEASFEALLDALTYHLWRNQKGGAAKKPARK